jgi:DNA-binding MarR family transcriptional regulator
MVRLTNGLVAVSEMDERDELEAGPATTPADEELVEQVMALLPDVGKLLYSAIARHAREAGLSLPQIKALSYLFHRGPSGVRDVADGLGISMATASESLDRLVELGLLERATDPVDRRRAIVALTPRAEGLLAEVDEVRRRQVRAALGLLAPPERPFLPRAIQALVEALRDDAEHSTCPAATIGRPEAADDNALASAGAGKGTDRP